MSQVALLGLVLSLSLGLVSLALLARLPGRDAAAGIRWLPITLLLYNLWVAAFLASASLESGPGVPTPLADLGRLSVIGLALAWLGAHITLLHAFVPLGAPRALRGLRAALITTGILLLTGWVLSLATGNRAFLLPLAFAARIAVFPAALIASGLFVARALDVKDPAWRARYAILGFSNAVLFASLFALTVGWRRLAAMAPELPVVLDVVLEMLYNAMAVLWVIGLARWYPRPAASAALPTSPIASPTLQAGTAAASVSVLFAARGITKREAEIIELICQGKTNQEIADQLFISLTTVKDHNYVTFQKLGVRNRTELTRLVLGGRAQPKSAS